MADLEGKEKESVNKRWGRGSSLVCSVQFPILDFSTGYDLRIVRASHV